MFALASCCYNNPGSSSFNSFLLSESVLLLLMSQWEPEFLAANPSSIASSVEYNELKIKMEKIECVLHSSSHPLSYHSVNFPSSLVTHNLVPYILCTYLWVKGIGLLNFIIPLGYITSLQKLHWCSLSKK